MKLVLFVFFFKQKTAYEMRISDWSSDVCSSDLPRRRAAAHRGAPGPWRLSPWPWAFCPRRPRSRFSSCARPCPRQIGRASCRESVCQYVSISVVAVSLTTTSPLHNLPTSKTLYNHVYHFILLLFIIQHTL